MKTYKQIKLTQIEVGKEKFSLSKNVDQIFVKKNSFLKKVNAANGLTDSTNAIPFLRNGVLVIDCWFYEKRILFYVEPREESFEIEMDFLKTSDSEKTWLFTCCTEIPYILKSGEDFVIKKYVDAEIEIMVAQGRRKSEIENTINANIGKAQNDIVMSLLFFAYINNILEHPEEKNIENSKQRNTDMVTRKQRARDMANKEITSEDKTYKEHIVIMNDIKVVTRSRKISNSLRSKKKYNVLNSWGVRGHYRHYKSGKVVYVKPYTKGKDKSRQIIKKYKV